jgi:hypothetical protein
MTCNRNYSAILATLQITSYALGAELFGKLRLQNLQVGDSNKNVNIKFSAHDALLDIILL